MESFVVASQLSSEEFQPISQTGIELWKLLCAQYCAWAWGIIKEKLFFFSFWISS